MVRRSIEEEFNFWNQLDRDDTFERRGHVVFWYDVPIGCL